MATRSRFKGKKLIGTIAFLAVLMIAGRTYQSIAQRNDLAKYPPPGRLIAVDGHRMHLHCVGEGSPTVVVEQGLGASAEAWRFVQEQSAKQTRVCVYDRPGLGYSEPVDRPMVSSEVADNLHKLLNVAGIRDSLILVGWSRGGAHIREFQRRYPTSVVGMVFVDSSHEQQRRRSAGESGASHPMQAAMSAAEYLASFGAVRLISGFIENKMPGINSPHLKDRRDALIAQYNQSHYFAALNNEFKGSEMDSRNSTPPSSLGNLPLIVIVQGKPIDTQDMTPPQLEAFKKQRQLAKELQLELAALSSNSKYVVADRSGHSIHVDQPELLIQSIGEIVNTVRDGSRVVGATRDDG